MQADTERVGRSVAWQVRSAVTCVAVVLAVLVVPARAAQAATPVVYQGHVYSSGATAASADKPQSKLWHNAGSWWALMVNAAGTVNIFELQADHRWRDTGTVVDERTTSTGDALWSGGTLYVASRTLGSSGAVRVNRFSYNAASRSYTSGGAPFSFGGGGTESATIDRDSTGALWVTFTRGSKVWVSRTTDAAQTAWTAPFLISGADTAVSSDDISAVVAFDGKIGVLWSDQASDAIRFAYHVDGAADSSWIVETPLSGTGLADDHVNIKSLQGDDQGRLYAAVKISLTASTDPNLMVLTRTANGAWSATATATVADKLTRPQVVLDKTNRVLHVLQSTEGGGSIFHKSSPLSDRPSFPPGKGAPFITWSGAKINDVSTSKHPVTSTTGLVAIASDQFAKRYYHAELALAPAGSTPPPASDTTPPPAPTLTPGSGTYTSTQSVALASEPGAVIRYTVGQGTTVPADPTSTSTLYSGPLSVSTSQIVKARAFDSAGNASAVARADYTISTVGSGTRQLVLQPGADTMVKQALPSTGFGSSTSLQVDAQDGSGTTNTAVHSYLRFAVPALAAGESISAASLSLQLSNSTSNGPAVWRTDSAWTETGTTWNVRPARVGSAPAGNYGSMAIARVSTAVSGISAGGEVSFELAPEATDGMDFASREDATTTRRPTLTLTVVTG